VVLQNEKATVVHQTEMQRRVSDAGALRQV